MTGKKKGHKAQKLRRLLPLHLLFLFFSISGVLSKYASAEELLSARFILFYGLTLAVLFAYSILWQFVLRRFSLTVVYANRAVVTIWGILWGIVLFGEQVSIAKITSALLIVSGIVIMGKENE